jgi:hypothetical protein
MKIQAGQALKKRMTNHDDLAYEHQPVLPAAPASRGMYDAPVLDEAVTALMIVAGVSARWAINYWQINDKAGHRHSVHATATFEDWHHALQVLATCKIVK